MSGIIKKTIEQFASLVLILFLFVDIPTSAAQNSPAADPVTSLQLDASESSLEKDKNNMDQAMADLLRVLEEETELATKTKLNVDFVPGMVSVLQSKDMLAKGARTVYDALGFIPGVELSAAYDGQIQVIFRGVGKTFSSGKVKVLLNGMTFNATLQAAMPALLWPLDQVDRIEVIRGPGSVIYGEFASVGVINIITTNRTDQVYIRDSNKGNNDFGAQLWKEFPSKNISLSLNVAAQNSEGGQLQAGEDVLYNTPNQSVSNAPGPVNTKRENRYFILDFNYKDFSISWQHMEAGSGDHYGIANALPSNSDRIVRTAGFQGIELSKPWKLAEHTNTKLALGWFKHKLVSEQHEIFPNGFVAWPNTPFETTFDDGVLGGPNYEEQKYYLAYELSYSAFKEHDLLFGVDYSNTKQGDTWAQRNYAVEEVGGYKYLEERPNQKYTGEDNWLAENLSRRVIGVYLQDQYAFSKKLDFTFGLRFDDYDDIGSDVTPRIAGVYHLSDEQTLKMQYAQSFRPPTFLEMYTKNNIVVTGNPDLKSEQLDSIDIGYVYNNGLLIGRATIFYYMLEGLIAIDNTNQMYSNIGDVHAIGFELEYVQQLSQFLKLDANISYTDAEIEHDVAIPGVATTLGNLGLIYQIYTNITFNAQYRHVGERSREIQDTRSALKGYDVFDITFSFFNFLTKDLTARLTIKNIFDKDVVYPSSLVYGPQGPPKPAYQDDYVQQGREAFLHLAYEF